MKFSFSILSFSVVLATSSVFAQQKDLKGWQYLDPKTDNYNGISLAQTYDFLKGKKSKQVIVAVIDSGVDTTHERFKKYSVAQSKRNSGQRH